MAATLAEVVASVEGEEARDEMYKGSDPPSRSQYCCEGFKGKWLDKHAETAENWQRQAV